MWKYRNASSVLWSEEPRHHSASGVMKWGLAEIFSLPVFLSPSYESSFCSFSYWCPLPLFGYGNGFHGGNNHTKDCAFCVSAYTIEGNVGIQRSGEPRESSYWFPLTNCWTLRAGLSPWRNLSCYIYITGFDIPVRGRQNQGALGKGKVFAPPPLPRTGTPAPLHPVKLQQWKEKHRKNLQMGLCFSKWCILGEKNVFKFDC